MKRTIALIILVVAIAGTIIYVESQKVARPSSQAQEEAQDVARTTEGVDEQGNMEGTADAPENTPQNTLEAQRITQKEGQFRSAKEIVRPAGFINTDEITISELIGKKVILLDIWTYSCINCQRTLPYITSWYEKYEDDGLEIIGIHTPEFEFEKKQENVQKAVDKWGIEYPVVLDNAYGTWTAYGNRYWPRKYLIDIDGFIRYDHIGEGAYDETERKIVELLNERKEVLGEGGTVTIRDEEPEHIDEVDFGKVGTPETYLGAARIQYLTNLPEQSCLTGACSYTLPESLSQNRFALEGEWEMTPEYAHFIGEDIGIIKLYFSSNKVNLVAGTEGGAVRARILLDGEPITTDAAGADVENGIVTFTEHELYNLVDLKGNYGEHTITIEILDSGLQGFAFTFG